MGCCASTFQRAPTSARTARTILRPWRSPSTAGRERPWAGEHRPRLWTSSSDQLIQAVLRRPLESTLFGASRVIALGPGHPSASLLGSGKRGQVLATLPPPLSRMPGTNWKAARDSAHDDAAKAAAPHTH